VPAATDLLPVSGTSYASALGVEPSQANASGSRWRSAGGETDASLLPLRWGLASASKDAARSSR
jgi:hypothetical protein